jgi:outer membrane protein OmpA-like peptidoglycan-associated protein
MARIAHLVNLFCAVACVVQAQVANPTQSGRGIQPEPGMPSPIFRIQVVSHTTPAVNYLHRGGSTKINFEGTPLMAAGKGLATVQSERGVIAVSAEFRNFAPPSSFGPEYLTYVLWAISPDGRPVNMGELTLSDYGNGSKSDIKTTSEIQTFGMIVTAEPYYAVTQPSDVVVMENVVRNDTRGVIESIDAKYELLPRGVYTSQGRARGFVPILVGKKDPFELYEAENAVQLSRVAGAQQYAADSFNKAQDALERATKYQNQKPGQKPVITMAREAVLRAEDARVIAIRAARDEADARDRQAALDRENAAKAQADAAKAQADAAQARATEEARQRAVADTQRAQADADRARANADRTAALQAQADAQAATADAQAATRDAQRERQQAETAKLEADRARQAALDEQQKLAADAAQARLDASKAQADAARAQQDQQELRRQLLLQFNAILQTRDTARGLIVNISDVLFDTARYELKPGAREKLAKVSGIILAHPGLRIAVEGHTDSVGGDEYNMRLSENRASSVRTYLVSQGLSADSITAQGFGKSQPVADNSTASGRQQNRRVELVVSGEIMGVSVNSQVGQVR